jgi:tetratricopeptide (TPR) repeat protein
MKLVPTAVVAALVCAQALAQTPVKNSPLTPGQQAEVRYRQGLAAEKAGDPVLAQAAFAEALKLNPNHANARYNLGQVKINAASIAARGRETKFGAVMIPEYKLDDASLQESLAALRMIIEKQSEGEVAANFVIQDPQNKLGAAKISLNLKSMPSRAVLGYVLEMTGAKARYDEFAIVITPR